MIDHSTSTTAGLPPRAGYPYLCLAEPGSRFLWYICDWTGRSSRLLVVYADGRVNNYRGLDLVPIYQPTTDWFVEYRPTPVDDKLT